MEKLHLKHPDFESFYGYTVDFKHNGEEYIMNGGSDVYVSELFDYLKIDGDTEYIEFSNDDYLREYL